VQRDPHWDRRSGASTPGEPRRFVSLADPSEIEAVDCSELKEKLGDYLDDDELEDLCETIDEHLKRCPDCQVYVDTVKKTVVLYQADRHVEIPAHVNRKLEEMLGRAYNGD
jgi:hypothetical protein